ASGSFWSFRQVVWWCSRCYWRSSLHEELLPQAIPTEAPMQLIRLAVIVALSLLSALTAPAQVSGTGQNVGLLSPPPGAYVAAFEESLRQFGYVRGVNIVF